MNARERMLQGRAQAEDPQPYRCVKCGEAVSMVRHNDCACTRAPSLNSLRLDWERAQWASMQAPGDWELWRAARSAWTEYLAGMVRP